MDDLHSARVIQDSDLENIRKIESGEVNVIVVSGNAWEVTFTRAGVSFEGLYDQGKGGQVTLQQYKFAVSTYMQMFKDPEHRAIELDFPEESL